MLVPLTEALAPARDQGSGLGAFNVIHLEHAEALVGAAEDARLAVVLQISENTVAWHGSLAPLALATRALAEHASVPVVLHLDHAVSVDLVREALGLGFTSVMFDGSKLDDSANRATTRAVVELCHARGARARCPDRPRGRTAVRPRHGCRRTGRRGRLVPRDDAAHRRPRPRAHRCHP
jgi:fructose-bisphosphate aldolase class II